MLHIRVGDSYRLDKNFVKAREHYKKALEDDPNSRYAKYGLKKINEMEKKAENS